MTERAHVAMQRYGLTRRDLLLGLIAAGGAGIVLSACGDDDEAATTSASGAPGTGSTTGTGTATGGPPSAPTGTLKVAIPIDPVTLDPARALEYGDLPIVTNVYEGLLRIDATSLELVPALASAWTSSDDGLEWTFTLTEGVTFHDGEVFDSAAAKATFEYYVAETDAFGALLMPSFKEIDASDPMVLRCVLNAPYGDMARNQSVVRMMSPALLAKGEEAIGREMVGTGPYAFVRADQGREVVLEAFADYRGPGPYFESLTFPVIADSNAQVTAVQTGAIDILTRVPAARVEELGSDDNLALTSRDSWGMAYLMFHGLSTVASDPRVRQAVGYAIDRAALLTSLTFDQGVISDTVIPAGVYGSVPATPAYSHNPDMARSLLAEAGAEGVELRLGMPAVSSIANASRIGEAILDQLNDVGFTATVEVVDEIVLSNDELGDAPEYDLYYTEFYWPTGGPVILSTGIFQAFTHFSTPEYEELLQTMNGLPDGDARLQTLADIQNLLAEQAPVLPLWTGIITDALRADIQGYEPTKDGLLNSYQSTFRVS